MITTIRHALAVAAAVGALLSTAPIARATPLAENDLVFEPTGHGARENPVVLSTALKQAPLWLHDLRLSGALGTQKDEVLPEGTITGAVGRRLGDNTNARLLGAFGTRGDAVGTRSRRVEGLVGMETRFGPSLFAFRMGGGSTSSGTQSGPFAVAALGWTLERNAVELGVGVRSTAFNHETTETITGFRLEPYDSIQILVPYTETQNHDQTAWYMDSHSRVTWSRGPIELSALAGLRLANGIDQEAWGQLAFTYWTGSNLAFTLAGGGRPSVPEEGLEGGNAAWAIVSMWFSRSEPTQATPVGDLYPRYPSVGLGETSDFDVEVVGKDLYSVCVTVADADRVELSGDFSNWEPIAMTPAGADQWCADVQAAPGTYRLSIRIDGGEWTCPPGLHAIADEFGTSTGVAVFR